MKISYDNWVSILNQKLSLHCQTTRVLEYKKDYLKLTSTVLVGKEVSKFKGRVMNGKTLRWISNIDKLIFGDITEKEIKSLIASDNGKICQQIHGVKLRKNLNTGIPWNKDKKGSQQGWAKGLSKHTDDRISRMAKNKIGSGNPMFGKKMNPDAKAKISNTMQSLILEGVFTPNSNNRNTHWDAFYSGKKYRSSWEALFQYFYPEALYESLRLEYNLGGKNFVYIVDFVDHNKKVVAEVKPSSLCVGEKFLTKKQKLEEWADNNGYKVILATERWFLLNKEPVSYDKFDEKTKNKIIKLYETNKKN